MRKSSGNRQAARARTSTRIARGDREHGEGNYKAARKYDEAVARFARSGKVARAARPRSHREAAEMERAEARGKSRSKGEDGGTARR
jgi:hypothetical protein